MVHERQSRANARGRGRHSSARTATAIATRPLAQIVSTLDARSRTSSSVDIDGQSLHAGRLRGPDARDPRRVAAAVRGRREPAPRRPGTANTLRGDVPATSSLDTDGKRRRRELRDGDLRNGHARHVRLHDGRRSRSVQQRSRRLRALRRRTARASKLGSRSRSHSVATGAAYSLHVADAPWRCSQCGTVNEPSGERVPARAAAGRASSTSRAARSRRTLQAAVAEEPYAAQTVDVDESRARGLRGRRSRSSCLRSSTRVRARTSRATSRRGQAWQRFARFIVPIGDRAHILISSIATAAAEHRLVGFGVGGAMWPSSSTSGGPESGTRSTSGLVLEADLLRGLRPGIRILRDVGIGPLGSALIDDLAALDGDDLAVTHRDLEPPRAVDHGGDAARTVHGRPDDPAGSHAARARRRPRRDHRPRQAAYRPVRSSSEHGEEAARDPHVRPVSVRASPRSRKLVLRLVHVHADAEERPSVAQLG